MKKLILIVLPLTLVGCGWLKQQGKQLERIIFKPEVQKEAPKVEEVMPPAPVGATGPEAPIPDVLPCENPVSA